MKLINDNLKIIEKYELNNNEAYIVENLENTGEKFLLELLEGNTHQMLIKDYINYHINYKNISHQYILKTIDFKRISSVNLKPVSGNMFYTVSEYTDWERLDNIKSYKTNEIASIFIKLFQTIEYLHFRGFTYKFLTPDNIFVSKDHDIKISSIGKVIEYSFYKDKYVDNHKYIAPEVFSGEVIQNFKSDYYSIGALLEDFFLPIVDIKDAKIQETIVAMIENLKQKNPELRQNKIRDYINEIIDIFKVEYNIEYIQERQKLYFDIAPVGMDSYIEQMSEIDNSMKLGIPGINGVIINGNPGTGRNKLLNEISNRMELNGRNVFRIDVDKNNILKSESLKHLVISFLETQNIEFKYLADKSIIQMTIDDSILYYDLTSLDDNYKLLNRIAEGFISISRLNPVYISISNLSLADLEILNNIDFLISRIKKSNVILLLTLDLETIQNNDLKNIINNWMEKDIFKEFKLDNLNKQNTISLIEAMVGSTSLPKEFSKLLYRESLGNPRYLNILLKHFYDINEMIINKNGEWEIKTKDYDNIYFPQNFGETINATFNNLNKQELRLLEIISCFEYPANEPIVIETMNIEKQSYNDLLEGLIEKKILNKTITEKDKKLAFLEGELKRHIYNLISDEEKLKHHTKISDIFLDRKSKREDVDFNSLIRQLNEANKLDTLYEIIQERIGFEGAKNRESAIVLLDFLFSKLDSKKHEKRMEVLEQLIQSYISIGKYLELGDYIDRLETISKELKLNDKIINSELYRFEVYVRTNNLTCAKELSKKLRSTPKLKENNEHLLEYIKIQALFMQTLGKDIETISLLKRAIDLAVRLDSKSQLGDLHNLLGIAYYFEGNHNAALDNYKLAIEAYDYSLRPYNVEKPLSNIGSIYNEVFSLPNIALDYFKQSNKIAVENNLLNGQAISLNNIGEAYFNMGDYENSEIYYKESIQLSKFNNDRTLQYLTTVNLGFNRLSQENLKGAIQIFNTLRQMNWDEPILDTQINNRYTNFLGNFYMALGDLELGRKFSQISVEKSKDINITEYIKASYRVFTIDSILRMSINYKDLQDIIVKFRKLGNILDRAYFILNIGFLAVRLNDNQAFKYLFEEFKTIDNQNTREVYKDDIQILNNLNSDDIESLIDTLEFLNKKDVKLSFSKIRYLSQLGKLFYEKNLYNHSIRSLFACLDLFYKITSNLGIVGYEKKLEAYYSIDNIKYLISEVFTNGFGWDVKINKEDFKRNYYDLRLYLDLLSQEDLFKIYKKPESIRKFKDLSELIESFYSDCENNINKLLEFISFHTFAENILIKAFNYPDVGESSEYLYKGNTKDIKLNSIIINAVRDGERILINKSSPYVEISGYEKYLSDDQIAFIGIPIFMPGKETYIKERRIDNKKENIYAYILISTTSGVNMFNIEKFKLIASLSKLIYLNLENMKLYKQSNFDKLTGALTRSSIERSLDKLTKEHIETSLGFAVIMLDIDRFKSINDNYGHQMGDRVLRAIGDILRENLRSTDLIGRYGGEEFLIILDRINSDDSFNIAKGILKAIENSKKFGIKEKVTVSIGISKFPEHTVFKDDLIYKADQALYYAKEILGRNQVSIWNSEMRDIENLQSYVHSIAFGGFANNINNVISLVDLSLMNRQEYSSERKIFVFLGMLIDGTEAEIATLILINNNELNKQYNRKNSLDTWIDNISINDKLLSRAIKSNETFTFIEWEPSNLIYNDSDGFNIKSLMLSPLLVNGKLRGVVYLEVPLKRKEFNSENLGFVETLSGVFSGNL